MANNGGGNRLDKYEVFVIICVFVLTYLAAFHNSVLLSCSTIAMLQTGGAERSETCDSASSLGRVGTTVWLVHFSSPHVYLNNRNTIAKLIFLLV